MTRSTASYYRSSIGDLFIRALLVPPADGRGVGGNRFPLVERALADVPALTDPEYAAGIRRHAENIVRRSRGNVPTTGFFCSVG